jgi:hypothetical protein
MTGQVKKISFDLFNIASVRFVFWLFFFFSIIALTLFVQDFNQNFPLILMPESRADQFFQLLNFKDFINNFVQSYMSMDDCQSYGFSIAIQCLAAFCNPWRIDCIDKSDPPAIIGLLKTSTLFCLNRCILFGQEVEVKDSQRIYDIIKKYCQSTAATGYFPDHVIEFYNFMNLNECKRKVCSLYSKT